jgi:hypothetical protein
MNNGDRTILAVGLYKCSEGTCDNSDYFLTMLYTVGLNGDVKCLDDNASCILDGETGATARRGIWVSGTGSGALLLRAITLREMSSPGSGGGIFIVQSAVVVIELCVFSNCHANGRPEPFEFLGGGALFISSGSTVDIYATSFSGNYGYYGNDIMNYGTVTIHDTCPSPYEVITPTQGKAKQS